MSPSRWLPAERSTAGSSCSSTSPRCSPVHPARTPLPERALLSEPRDVRVEMTLAGTPLHEDDNRSRLRNGSHRGRRPFLRHLAKETWTVGMVLRGVLTDNGPEFIGRDFTRATGELQLAHHRTPPRSPDHNAVVERFHETVLQERYRPAFHRPRFDRPADLEPLRRRF